MNQSDEKNKKDDFKKSSIGIETKSVYAPEDIKNLNFSEDIGFPGQYPFIRGIHPLMYRDRPWILRKYAGYSTSTEANKRFKFLIEQGMTGLSIAFDLPTQLGLDSDDPSAEGEVGRVGVAIDSLKDMEDLFEGISIEKVNTNMTINAVAPIFLAMYIVLAKKQGVDYQKMSGTVQNDILKEYIARGAWIFPVKPSLRFAWDAVEFCVKNRILGFRPITGNGYHIRESGANIFQEVAITFEVAKTYLKGITGRGIGIDEVAPLISFNFRAEDHFFGGIGKIRAARKIWSKIIRDELKAKSPKSMWLRTLAGGNGSLLTAEQPLNNIVRSSFHHLQSVLAGAQAVETAPYDEAYTIPGEESSKLCLRTGQILLYESGVSETVDPLGGSYYLEYLTKRIEDNIYEYMENIQKWGGIVEAIENQKIQSEIAKEALQREVDLQERRIVKVGMNMFTAQEEQPEIIFHQYDVEAAERQISRVKMLRRKRNFSNVKKALVQIKSKAGNNENLMPNIMNAVENYATVGEIVSVLKEVFGEYREYF